MESKVTFVPNPRIEDDTDLHRAAAFGQTAAIKAQINHNPQHLNQQNSYGQTPLHLAVWEGLTNTTKLLLSKGANPNIQDRPGHTSLHYAVARDNVEIVSMLITSGADIHKTDSYGFAPIDVAYVQKESNNNKKHHSIALKS